MADTHPTDCDCQQCNDTFYDVYKAVEHVDDDTAVDGAEP